MPLIEKGILVEGHDGATLVKKYYVQEKPANPYTVKRERDYKAYLWDKKAKCFVRRKVAPDEKGYMWSMGYNHCVGSYAPEAGSPGSADLRLIVDINHYDMKSLKENNPELGQAREVQLRWLLRSQKGIIKQEKSFPNNSAIILCGKILRVKRRFVIGFPRHLVGMKTEYLCQFTSLVPAVAEKLKIRQQPFSEPVRESGSSVPSPSWLPWMMEQGSVF